MGEIPKLLKSKLITTPNTALNLTTGAAVRPKNLSCVASNSKTEGESMFYLAFDFQNTLQITAQKRKQKTKLQIL